MRTQRTGEGGRTWRLDPPLPVGTHQRTRSVDLPPELEEEWKLRVLIGTDRFLRQDQMFAFLDFLVSIGVVPRDSAAEFLSTLAERYEALPEVGHPEWFLRPETMEDEARSIRERISRLPASPASSGRPSGLPR